MRIGTYKKHYAYPQSRKNIFLTAVKIVYVVTCSTKLISLFIEANFIYNKFCQNNYESCQIISKLAKKCSNEFIKDELNIILKLNINLYAGQVYVWTIKNVLFFIEYRAATNYCSNLYICIHFLYCSGGYASSYYIIVKL